MDEKDVILPNGLKVHYYEWPGSKPALIFLHPSSGYGRMWEATANHLGSRFHIYAIDQRGHGSSGRPDGDYSAEEYADDLRLFLTAGGVGAGAPPRPSLGARVGLVFAAVHPGRTMGLALVGGPHLSNFFPTREAVLGVLAASQRMLEAETEFASKDAALAYLRTLRPRDRDEALRHRVEHNLARAGAGWGCTFDKVRVALGVAHMADDLKKYAERTRCPVGILRGSHSSELTLEEARRVAGFWKNATVIDVEGDYALQMENPKGLAEALIRWSA